MDQSNSETETKVFSRSIAFSVDQTFGTFYVTKIPARKLLQVCFAEELAATEDADDMEYYLRGTQRKKSPSRLTEIADFIGSDEASFPNTIILAANYREDGTLLSSADELDDVNALRWRIEPRKQPVKFEQVVPQKKVEGDKNVVIENGDLEDDECMELVIPTNTALANIIDGQHRLKAFQQPTVSDDAKDMPLLCAIFLDLPSAYQGFLFATINFNQKSVNKSLAYQLYGLTGNPDVDKNPDVWSPDRSAVALSKRLNLDDDSPLQGRIIVTALNEKLLFKNLTQKIDWRVSTATVVDGLLRLFSKRPKFDRGQMFKKGQTKHSRSVLEDDGTPLRGFYIAGNDLGIYEIIKNYFKAVKKTFWDTAKPKSYIKRTVGMQALLEVLKFILDKYYEKHIGNFEVATFERILKPGKDLDFSKVEFQQASGIGKVQMRTEILQVITPVLDVVIKELMQHRDEKNPKE